MYLNCLIENMNLFHKFKKNTWQEEFTEESVYARNEYYANETFLILTIGVFIVSLISFITCYIEEYTYEFYSPIPSAFSIGTSFVAMVVSLILTMNGKLAKRHIKYCLFFITEITILVYIGVYGFNYTAIMFTIPILISNRYPSKRFQMVVSIFSIIMSALMPIICICLGQISKFVFFDHNQINFFEGTIIEVGESFYYSLMEHFDDIDWYYTYLDTFREASLACFFMTSLFVFINYLVVNAHRRSLYENETLIKNKLKGQRDLLLAKSVQESALPKANFTNYNKIKISGKMLPSEYVSGDFYDYFMIGKDKICLVVGDVSDHGLPSAMFMMSVQKTLRAVSETLTSPAEIVTKTNKIICERNEVNMFATIWLGIMDLNDGVIKFVNAGHPFPFVRKIDGEVIKLESETNAPVGIFDDEEYLEHSYQFIKGDEIIIYTDGIPEAEGEDRKQYGIDKLKESIKFAGNFEDKFVDDIINDLIAYTKSTNFADDVTLLTGKIFNC